MSNVISLWTLVVSNLGSCRCLRMIIMFQTFFKRTSLECMLHVLKNGQSAEPCQNSPVVVNVIVWCQISSTFLANFSPQSEFALSGMATKRLVKSKSGLKMVCQHARDMSAWEMEEPIWVEDQEVRKWNLSDVFWFYFYWTSSTNRSYEDGLRMPI